MTAVPAPESDEIRALKERLRQAAEENRDAWEALVGQFRPHAPQVEKGTEQ